MYFAPAGIGSAIIQYVQPTTGQTVVVNDNTDILVIDPAGLLATLTITMPTGVNGKGLRITSTAAITLLTLSGGTILGALTSMVVSGFAEYAYASAITKWCRTG